MRNSLFSDPPLTSIFLTGVICLFFPSQRVNLSFDFPFYGHLLREITVATGGKWTLFLVSVFSAVVITVVVGYTVCAWHFLLYTDCFFIAAGFRRECGKIYEMSLAQEDLYEMEKKKRERSAFWYSVYLWVGWRLYKDISSPNTARKPNNELLLLSLGNYIRRFRVAKGSSGTKPQYKTADNTLPAKQSAWYTTIYSPHLCGIVC